MRLLGFVALLFSWPALAEELDINGYSAALISGDAYYFGLTEGVRDAAKAAGFKVIESPELLRREDLATTLLMIVVAESRTERGSVELRTYDIVTRTRVVTATVPLERIASFGGRSSGKRNVSRGSKALIDGLGYTGFDQVAHQRNQSVLSLATKEGNQRPERAPESR